MAQMETGRRSGYERELSCGRFSKDRRAAVCREGKGTERRVRRAAAGGLRYLARGYDKMPVLRHLRAIRRPELCPCFCDSDDITCANLHPKLLRHRTGTLGRGNACCDFCLRIKESLGACEAGHPAFL
ncbi:MAG: L-2-amino-thiazoline-4-carboxylic acid hydrolase [Oscillospiraceae bacterium]